ncbi:class I SAM-dependent methyltransferase [Parahaliea mediterranea]|uniref:Class I SAM-dependent methyltransferase n=1 Tax=Parahaliea mediterranea TaxID=651086 RepID=A0A939DF86_9GAMM|nr:class I SAM-dependent methyltransferase [Parahaliea mediterranea]MBN7796432.1 class I SAM-dependent methyltransferase [Parahaliea mediterranea]
MRVLTALAAILALSAILPGQAARADDDKLAAILAERSAEDRARDDFRHPAETLAFFRVEPGMAVAEALPGGGWYTRILSPYLAPGGTLYGVSYVDRMWPMFGFGDDWVKERLAATKNFAKQARGYTGDDLSTAGFTFGTVPPQAQGSVDRVLMVRALHNLARFEDEAGTLSQALSAVRAMLKPDGLVGVVQHRVPESASGADGSRGYLKQSAVIERFEQAGFELVASSEINANPDDQPGEKDIVWRLPPSYAGSGDDPNQRAAMDAIGESDRMTLLFRRAASDGDWQPVK